MCLAFNGAAQVRRRQGRIEEARALLERALALALAHDLTRQALRTYNNVADIPLQADHLGEAVEVAQRGHQLAVARGDRVWENTLALMIATAKAGLGLWDDLALDGITVPDLQRGSILILQARVHGARGQRAALEQVLSDAEELDDVSNQEFAAAATVARAIALRALGDNRAALDAALPVAVDTAVVNEDRREAYVEAGLAALALGDEATVERLIVFVGELTPALRSPLMRAGAARFAGLLAQRRGDTATADERLVRRCATAAGDRGALCPRSGAAWSAPSCWPTSDARTTSQRWLGGDRHLRAPAARPPWLERARAVGRASSCRSAAGVACRVRGVLGLPDGITRCLFDLDGVLTQTAKVHAAAWKQTFDEYLRSARRRPASRSRSSTRATTTTSTSTACRAMTACATFLSLAGSSCPRARPTTRLTPRRSAGSATARTSSCSS